MSTVLKLMLIHQMFVIHTSIVILTIAALTYNIWFTMMRGTRYTIFNYAFASSHEIRNKSFTLSRPLRSIFDKRKPTFIFPSSFSWIQTIPRKNIEGSQNVLPSIRNSCVTITSRHFFDPNRALLSQYLSSPNIKNRSRRFHNLNEHEPNQGDISTSKNEGFLRQIEQSLFQEIIPYVLQEEHTGSCNSNIKIVILLAVSGGCDSIGLYHSIMQIFGSRENNNNRNDDDYTISDSSFSSYEEKSNSIFNNNKSKYEIHVAHFDHRLRGEESDGDRDFVQNLCRQANLPFHCFYWEKKGGFSQENARKWRKGKLQELLHTLTKVNRDDEKTQSSSQKLQTPGEIDKACNQNIEPTNISSSSKADDETFKYGVILTAHHKDDSDETILLKLLRGVHITNLRGIDIMTKGDRNKIFARPMLSIRKKDIISFLKSQKLTWREDASNASNKYFRNRVRNELIPLMSDMVGDKDILQKRLENLEKQSVKIHGDLRERAEQYLAESLLKYDDPSKFYLPQKRVTLNLLEEEALQLWYLRFTDENTAIPYSRFTAICQQLENFPNKTQWTINVGSGWDICRNGGVLFLTKSTNQSEERINKAEETQWEIYFKELHHKSNRDEGYENIVFPLNIITPKTLSRSHNNLVVKTVRGNEAMTFLPPWRVGRNPVKIKEFLRGQKVPLYQRSETPILYFSGDEDRGVVAVFLDKTKLAKKTYSSDNSDDIGKWIVSADFMEEPNNVGAKIKILLHMKSNAN